MLASRKSHSHGLVVRILTRYDGAVRYFSIDFDPFLLSVPERPGVKVDVFTLRHVVIQEAEEQADELVREKTPHRCSDGCSKWNRVADSH